MTALTLKPESSESKLFEVPVSDLMSWGLISGNKIQGTLKYLDGDNAITNYWGPGYFFPFKVISDDWDQFTSVKVGLVPSAGSGPVEILTDPDKNGIFKISDKDTQKFVIEATNGTETKTQIYDLSALSFVK